MRHLFLISLFVLLSGCTAMNAAYKDAHEMTKNHNAELLAPRDCYFDPGTLSIRCFTDDLNTKIYTLTQNEYDGLSALFGPDKKLFHDLMMKVNQCIPEGKGIVVCNYRLSEIIETKFKEQKGIYKQLPNGKHRYVY